MSVFDASPRTAVSGRVRELVRRIAAEAYGATETEVPIPGFTVFTDRRFDDPLAGIRSALLVHTVAESQLTEYARAARAAGRSWDQIADALDITTDEVAAVGEAAFDWLVCGQAPDPEPDGVRSFRTPCAYWRCLTCDGLVTDHGPFEGNPANSEDGHAKGCTRHAADVQAWNEGREH